MIATAAFASETTQPIFIHHKKIKSSIGTPLKLRDYKPNPINVTYIPQQIIHVKDEPRTLALAKHTYKTGAKHLRCLFQGENGINQSQSLELLARKEPLGKTMANLLDKKNLALSQQSVIRLYRKVGINQNNEIAHWKPILTLPETPSAIDLLKKIKICPKGTIFVDQS